MQCSCFSLQFPSCMIDGIGNAVCRFGEELVVIVERQGSRDTGFDGSRGEGQSVCRVFQKGFGKRSRTCMMVMELKAILTDGAVQQLTVPYAIGSGVVEVFVHFGLCKYHFRLCILEVLLLVLLFSSRVLGPHFLDYRHI